MQIIKIPGLIDPHVHLRDPGQTEKEDFTTGIMAAIAGGFTTVLDMPNNKTPVFSAVDYNIPLYTDLKKATLFVRSVYTKKPKDLHIKAWGEYNRLSE